MLTVRLLLFESFVCDLTIPEIFSLVITGQISSYILHMSGCLAMITEWLQLMPNLSTMQHPMYCSLEKCSPGSSVDCLYKKLSKGV